MDTAGPRGRLDQVLDDAGRRRQLAKCDLFPIVRLRDAVMPKRALLPVGWQVFDSQLGVAVAAPEADQDRDRTAPHARSGHQGDVLRVVPGRSQHAQSLGVDRQ